MYWLRIVGVGVGGCMGSLGSGFCGNMLGRMNIGRRTSKGTQRSTLMVSLSGGRL